MPSKQDVIDSINAGIARVNATFGSLTEAQLQQQIYDGPTGWTAKHILAHLAGGQAAYDITFGMADGTIAVPSGASDEVNEFNRNVVEARLGKSRDALLEEFNSVNRSLIARVQDTDDALLAMEIESPNGTLPFGEILIQTSGAHVIGHTRSVEQALERSAPSNRGS